MAANRCAAASKSIWSIGTGICMVTPSIPRSKKRSFTFLSIKVTANFSRAPNRIATSLKSGSIRRFYRRRSAPTFRSRGRGVLDAAAQFRMQKKAARIRAKSDNHGRDEALFQEIAAALGYKENKLPLTLIAQRLSLKALRKDLKDAEAILFGIAGLLETPDLAIYKKSAKNYVRELWDRWWPHRDAMPRLILPARIWKSSSTRPTNHPQRRLAALAVLAREWPDFRRSLTKRAPKTIENFFDKH